MEFGIIVDHKGYEKFFDEKYKKLKEHGFTCADYNMSNVYAGIYVLDDSDTEKMMLHEKNLAKEAGVRIHQVHGPWDGSLPEKTEEGLKKHMNDYKKSIRCARMLGCDNWVIHPLLPFGGDEINTDDEKRTWEINLKFFTELLTTAKENDVTICLENMPFLNYSMSKPEVILEFVNLINDDNFKICLDTGHVATFRELSLGDEVRRLGSKIKTFHIHDTIYGKDLHLFPYDGVADWKDFGAALKDIEFDGVFSLETQPSGKLPLHIFEEMSKLLYKIVRTIV